MAPPAPITGSTNMAAMVSGPSRRISGFQLGRKTGGILLLALALSAAAVIVGAFRSHREVERQVEAFVIEVKPVRLALASVTP